MRFVRHFFSLLTLLMSLDLSAQSNIPQVTNFSAEVRDANNALLANTNVTVRFTFRQGSASGSIVYCALHQALTNQNGFVSLQLNRNILGIACNGAPNISYENIPWEQGSYWLQIEYQTVPNNPFVSLGALELTTTFYAYAAGTAERVANFNLLGAQQGDVLTYNISNQKWEPKAVDKELPATAQSGDVLTYNITNQKWEPKAVVKELPATAQSGDVLTYNISNQKWEPNPVLKELPATANNGDMLRYNATLQQWESVSDSIYKNKNQVSSVTINGVPIDNPSLNFKFLGVSRLEGIVNSFSANFITSTGYFFSINIDRKRLCSSIGYYQGANCTGNLYSNAPSASIHYLNNVVAYYIEKNAIGSTINYNSQSSNGITCDIGTYSDYLKPMFQNNSQITGYNLPPSGLNVIINY